jgi:hypothetical protein
MENLPEHHRDSPIWRHIGAQLEQAAAGVDVDDLGIALRLALMLEGLSAWRNEAPVAFDRAGENAAERVGPIRSHPGDVGCNGGMQTGSGAELGRG